MPFTFSHPAAIIPFKSISRDKVSLTALAIGSMVPDFEFFFRMRADTYISHTLKGIFLFDIPVVLLLAFLYHCFLRNPFLDHLPAILQIRFSVYKRFDWIKYFKDNWLIIIYSAFLGTVLHFLFDDFTHDYGWTAQNLRVLSSSYNLMGYSIPGYHILQYLSSLIMGILLILEGLKLPPVYPAEKSTGILYYWGVIAIVTLLSFALRYFLRSRELIMDDWIMTVIASGLVGVIASSLLVKILKHKV